MSNGLFFDLDPAIVDRLREVLPPGTPVLTAEDLDGMEEAGQPAPAVHVIYDGYAVREQQRTVALTNQRWLVVAVVKHSGSGARAAAETKQRAAPLVLGVIDALLGWRPDVRPGTPGLKLATPPRPARRAPYYYFPTLFTADVPVTSRSNANG